jgi:hypothetical protein
MLNFGSQQLGERCLFLPAEPREASESEQRSLDAST